MAQAKNLKPLELLRKFRKQRGLTQEEMAEKLGINRVTYTKIELGYREPDLEFIRSFEKAFGFGPRKLHKFFIASECSEAEAKPTTSAEGSH